MDQLGSIWLTGTEILNKTVSWGLLQQQFNQEFKLFSWACSLASLLSSTLLLFQAPPGGKKATKAFKLHSFQVLIQKKTVNFLQLSSQSRVFFKWPDSYQPLQDHMLIGSTLSRRRMFLLSSYTTYSKIQSDCTKLSYSFSPEQITVLGREREWHEEVDWSGLEEGPSKKSCSYRNFVPSLKRPTDAECQKQTNILIQQK